jgi:endoglucanase
MILKEENVDLQIELLKKLSETPGVSGYEEPVRKIVNDELEKIMDEVKTDKLGNVIGFKKARKEGQGEPIKVMVAAHMDEIGFLVRYIDKDGFLRITPLGGFDSRTLIAQRVIVHGKRDIKGIIPLPKPMFLPEENDKNYRDLKDLYIDVGMDKEEVAKYVKVGDIVSLDQNFMKLNEQVVTSRNFDDRMGVFVMIEALKRLEDCYADIYAVGTVQEELGLRGGTVASFSVEPDIGIAIDGSLAYDFPNVKDEDKHCFLGGGTGIYIVDNRTLSDKKIVNFLKYLAEENNIRYQLNIGGGTDAAAMQRNKTGTLVCTIGAPIRNMHSTVQLCHLGDIEYTVELLKVFLEKVHKIDTLLK